MRQPKVSVSSKEWLWFTLPFVPHIPALSHFFGWSSAFCCVTSENWSSSKLKQEQQRSLYLHGPIPFLCQHQHSQGFVSIISTSHLPILFFYEVTLQLNQLSNTANAPAVQAPAEGRRKESQSGGKKGKAAPAAAAQPQISTGQPCKAQLGCLGLPGELGPHTAHEVPTSSPCA